MLWATYASCSPWMTSTRRSRGSASAALSSWAKLSSIWTRIDSATSEALKSFSLDSPKNSAEHRHSGLPYLITNHVDCSLPTDHLQQCVGITSAMYFDLRRGPIDFSKVLGNELNVGGAEVLLEPVTFCRPGNRHDPRLLRE